MDTIVDDSLCSNFLNWIQDDSVWYIYLFLWICGMLGSLANIIVFNHERMNKSYTTSLLYWLAVCNFIELFAFFVLAHNRKFSLSLFYDFFFAFISVTRGDTFDFEQFETIQVFEVFLLFTMRNISFMLNITIIIVQLVMIVDPLLYGRLFVRSQSTKCVVNYILVINIIVSSWFLTSTLYEQRYPQKVKIGFDEDGNCDILYSRNQERYSRQVTVAICRDALMRMDDVLEEVVLTNRTKSEDFNRLFIKKFGSIQKPNASSVAKWYSKSFKHSLRDILLSYTYYEVDDSVTLFRYHVVRIGLLFLLMMTNIRLILRSYRHSRHIEHLLRGSRVMNGLTLWAVFMFSLTEIPMMAHSFLMLPVNTLQLSIHYFDEDYFSKNLFGSCNVLSDLCCRSVYFIATALMLFSLLFGSSFTVFSYFMMSHHYRDTLKSVWVNLQIFRPLKKIVSHIRRTMHRMAILYNNL